MSMALALHADLIRESIEAAARAALPSIPAANGSWTVEAAERPATLAGGQGVIADLDGLGSIAFVFVPRLARQLQVGPPPADDLLEGATPALKAAAAVLSSATGSAQMFDGEREIAGATIESPVSGSTTFAVHLLDGDEHAASFVVTVPTSVIQAAAATVVEAADFETFEPTSVATVASDVPVTVLHDVELGVTVELGRTKMLVRDVLGLSIGSVVELDRTAGSPVDVYVNGTLIARGEVVVIDEEFGVRISEVIGYQQDRGRR
jgi:flagellar motor switch protein FliN